MGGRRRRNKKSTKRTRRRIRGGMGYGMSGTIGTAGPVWGSSWGGETTKSGEPIYDTADRPAVGGRRRKSRKASKKSRRKSMRGGGSIGVVGAGFAGTGARGIADYKPYASNLPPGGAFAIPTGTR